MFVISLKMSFTLLLYKFIFAWRLGGQDAWKPGSLEARRLGSQEA